MSNLDVIRAWKDEAYRLSLSEVERARLPENPTGTIELDEADLSQVAGGTVVTLDTICISLRACTFGGDCPSLIYSICGTYPIFCCTPLPV